MSNLKVPWKSVVKKAIIVVFLLCVAFSAFYQSKIPEMDIAAAWSQSGKGFSRYTWDRENSTLKIEPTLDEDPFLIPEDEVLQKMSEDNLLRVFWKYINTIQTLCRTQTRVGHLDDGGKEMCVDQQYIPQQHCIVYSFGSNFQFDFDLAMHNHYGCEVFTYDPSMDIKGRIIPPALKFELRGLAGRDYVNDKQWKMSTLESIMRDNGHLNKTIDILKVDVEGSEWEALPPFLQSGLHNNVKQILIEIHVGRTKLGTLWGETQVANQLSVLKLLYASGFRIFQRERNLGATLVLDVPPSRVITTCNEISLINMKYYS